MWKREEDKRRLREAESKRGAVGEPAEAPKPQESDLAQSDSERGTGEVSNSRVFRNFICCFDL